MEWLFGSKAVNIPSRLAIDVTVDGPGSSYQIYHIQPNNRTTFDIDTNISLNKKDFIKVRFPVSKENSELSQITRAVFTFSFSQHDKISSKTRLIFKDNLIFGLKMDIDKVKNSVKKSF